MYYLEGFTVTLRSSSHSAAENNTFQMLELSQIFASVSFNSKIGNKEFMGIMHTQGFLFLKRMSNVADHSEYTEIPTLERFT